MRGQKALSLFLILSMALPLLSGCIGLVPAREFLESMRDEPEVGQVVEELRVSHTFTSLSVVEMTWSEDFFVDQHVTEISAYITVSHFFSDTSSSVLPNESRYVRANLQDAAGAIVWETEISESRTEPLYRMQAPFSQGEWSLSVEARGYGEQFLNQFQDSFLVAIEVEKSCTTYPTENNCSFD